MNNRAYKEVSILLVEDDDIDAMSIERALKKLRLANPYYRAVDGVEGLAILRNQGVGRPFIILLDLNMPRMNGLEMLVELRKDPKLTDSVVFVLTTSNDDQDRAQAYKEHIAGYIVKSKLDSDFTELLQLLDHYWRLVELPVDHN
ncbi:response regulator receiver protein [Shewanella denitrificans OS217]|jgi:CheY-like chemotaxis protein|uniref:Response regulator receiver protein n=1 Tax=Shewanella denitrificans (strain OS217 / ATCC BAA-1090 / DSM 15013) TaxID=318161 RepID=Q12I47_SHEDO|nr:response regulator [Shewanella denitrificans]ABE56879.1 response regulator receiver protein [Shewanella denitrificans OS217]